MWKDSIRNVVVIFQTTILRIVGFYVRHSAIALLFYSQSISIIIGQPNDGTIKPSSHQIMLKSVDFKYLTHKLIRINLVAVPRQ